MLRKIRKQLIVCAMILSMVVCSSCGKNAVDNRTEPTVQSESMVQTEPTKQIELAPTEQTDTIINVKKEEVSVSGLTKEHRIFFLADSHISMCDERDAEVMEKAKSRESSFAFEGVLPQDRFDSLIDYANESDFELVILGGDIIDSAMYSSIEHVENKLGELSSPYILLMGNHDFEYGSEYFSETAYNIYLPRLANVRSNQPYQVLETEDIIYFSLDDCNKRIDSVAVEALKEEAAKGKPMVVALHTPIEPLTGDMSLVEDSISKWGASDAGKSKVTLGVNGCYPDPTTKEFIDFVSAEDSPVVLVLAGHVHFYHRDMLNNDTIQLVTGAAFEGDAIEITLK